MRRSLLLLGLAAACAALGRASAASYSAKPPMIGGAAILPQAVAFDAFGNRYVAGVFFGSADFDPGRGGQTRTAHGAGPEPFITRFDKDGSWRWTQTFGGTGTDSVAAILVDGDAVFVAGTFDSDDAGFGGTGSISSGSDAQNYGAGYVICLSAETGAPARSFNGTGAQIFGGTGGGRATATCLAVSGAGTLYVGGSFTSFGFGVGGGGPTNTTSQFDGYVAALDETTGAPKSGFGTTGVQTFAGDGNELVRGLAVSGTRVFAGGDFSSTNFGIGGTGSLSSGQVFHVEGFVAALDGATGAPATAFGGDGIVVFGGPTTDEESTGLAAANGVVYLAGDFSGSDARVDGVGPPAPVVGMRDLYVAAFSAANGVRVEAFAGGVQIFGSLADDRAGAIAATDAGVFLLGRAGAPGGGVGGAGSLEASNAFLLALDPATGLGLSGFGDGGLETATLAKEGASVVELLGVAAQDGDLAVAGSTPSGGAFDATKFPAVGAFVVDLDPATGAPRNMGLNRKPSFAAPLIPSANPIVQGQSISFRASASDPDGDKLAWEWEWGDGSFDGGKSPKKSWKLPGTYRVRATIADGRGGQATSLPLDVTVVPRSTPYFDVAKTTISLRFSAPKSDTIVVSGQIPVTDGVPLDGKIFAISIGALSRSFVVNFDGSSTFGDEVVTVKPASHDVSKFVVKLTHGDYANALAPLGLLNATLSNHYVAVPITISFFGATYDETVPLLWNAKIGASGTAK